jgi:hypothetical protein
MKSVLEDVTTSLLREAPMEDTLREFGSRLLRTVLTEKQTKLIRLISMESSRFPALGELFFELGPKRGQAFLADYLAGQVQQHRLRDGDTARMAEHYMSLLSGGAVRWIILGLRRGPLRRDKLGVGNAADPLGPGRHGSIHAPDHWFRHPCGIRRWCRPLSNVQPCHSRATLDVAVPELRQRSTLSVPPMAGQSACSGVDTNQVHTLRSPVPSIRGTANRQPSPRVFGSPVVLDDDRS